MRELNDINITSIDSISNSMKLSEPVITTSSSTRIQSRTDFSPDRSQAISNISEEEGVFCDYILPTSPCSISLSPQYLSSENNSLDTDNDDEYFGQFACPDESDDDMKYFADEINDDFFIENHVNRKQLQMVDSLQDNVYERPRRSHKKVNAQRQIKTKQAKSIQVKSHNKQLHIHHRLAKKVILDEARTHFIPSPEPVPLYSLEELRSIVRNQRIQFNTSYIYSLKSKRKIHSSSDYYNLFYDDSRVGIPSYFYEDYTFVEDDMPVEHSYDDTMMQFLLEMQNRDLSPDDYEMLLRLDERIQPKTVDSNVLETLQTVDANETHLDEQCTICMEKYIIGQELKLLPCTHVFHLHCIEKYLKEFSIQCPLDNLPLI